MFFFTLLSLSFVVGILAAPLAGNATSLSRRAATLYTQCTTPNTVALTFDDGPYIYLNEVVNQLDAAGAKGTFFFNGRNWDCIYNPDAMARVKYAYERGHMIASHTWSHRDLATLPPDQVNEEMSRVELAFQRIVGVTPAFMRPPYGSYSQIVLEISGTRGQSLVNWDFDSRDSAGASPDTSKQLYDEVVNRHPNTILTLHHETIETTVHQVLPYAISRLRSAGYRLVTVAECLGLPAYQSVGSPQTPDPSWTC